MVVWQLVRSQNQNANDLALERWARVMRLAGNLFILHFALIRTKYFSSLFCSSKKERKKDASYEGFLLRKTVSKTPRRTVFV
jgi:hypothetical protein